MLQNRLKNLQKRFWYLGFDFCLFSPIDSYHFNFVAIKINPRTKQLDRIVLARVVERERFLGIADVIGDKINDFVSRNKNSNIEFQAFVFWKGGEKRFVFNHQSGLWEEKEWAKEF